LVVAMIETSKVGENEENLRQINGESAEQEAG
jgi:hypothetical protein